MTLRPRSGRVLIRPEQAATQTASGLHLSEHWKPEQMGTVIAIGAASCARCRTTHAADFSVGDRVLFAWNVGQELFVNDGEERYIMLRVDDVLAVMESV